MVFFPCCYKVFFTIAIKYFPYCQSIFPLWSKYFKYFSLIIKVFFPLLSEYFPYCQSISLIAKVFFLLPLSIFLNNTAPFASRIGMQMHIVRLRLGSETLLPTDQCWVSCSTAQASLVCRAISYQSVAISHK